MFREGSVKEGGRRSLRYFPGGRIVRMMMGRHRLLRALIMAAALCSISVFLGGGANAALVKVGDLVLHADGYFKPAKLPKHKYRAGRPLRPRRHPPDDRRSRRRRCAKSTSTSTRTGCCSPRGWRYARRPDRPRDDGQRAAQMRSAIVGEGRRRRLRRSGRDQSRSERARHSLQRAAGERQPDRGRARPRRLPVPRTYVVVIPIERRQGAYAYRAHIDVPKIAEDGVLSHIDWRIVTALQIQGQEPQLRLGQMLDRRAPHPRPLPLRRRRLDDHRRVDRKALLPRVSLAQDL